MADSDRQMCIRAAKLAEIAECYEDMIEEMNKVAKMGEGLTVEERNLLSVGYENTIGRSMDIWKRLSKKLEEESESNEMIVGKINGYMLELESKIIKICGDILPVIEHLIIPSFSKPDASMFYYKMKGDCCMHLAEIKTGDERKEAADESRGAYDIATLIAEMELKPTDPIRLSLALNLSVLHYEILNEPDRACEIAEKAIARASSRLDSLNEDERKESTLTLSTIEINIKLWKSGMPDEGGDKHTKIAPPTVPAEGAMPGPVVEEVEYQEEDMNEDEDDDEDEDEDRAGGSKQSRCDRKNRKAMLKLGMEPVAGVSLVTFWRKTDGMRTICNPDVFKSPKTGTYIFFGEAKYEMRRVGQAAYEQRYYEIYLAEQDKENLEVDETGLEFRTIVSVMAQACVSRTKAVETLRNHNGDFADAVTELIQEIGVNAIVLN